MFCILKILTYLCSGFMTTYKYGLSHEDVFTCRWEFFVNTRVAELVDEIKLTL